MNEDAKFCSTGKKTVICISGMAGTGKSTLSKKLAEKYHLSCYSGGDALKELANAEGYDASRQGWWESPEGLKFLDERVKDPKFDKAVDAKLIEYAGKGNVLLDSWTMPWLIEDGFKIWLLASTVVFWCGVLLLSVLVSDEKLSGCSAERQSHPMEGG